MQRKTFKRMRRKVELVGLFVYLRPEVSIFPLCFCALVVESSYLSQCPLQFGRGAELFLIGCHWPDAMEARLDSRILPARANEALAVPLCSTEHRSRSQPLLPHPALDDQDESD